MCISVQQFYIGKFSDLSSENIMGTVLDNFNLETSLIMREFLKPDHYWCLY
ncbi:hypothetical protein ACJX0J_032204, partial [Zea mays]